MHTLWEGLHIETTYKMQKSYKKTSHCLYVPIMSYNSPKGTFDLILKFEALLHYMFQPCTRLNMPDTNSKINCQWSENLNEFLLKDVNISSFFLSFYISLYRNTLKETTHLIGIFLIWRFCSVAKIVRNIENWLDGYIELQL